MRLAVDLLLQKSDFVYVRDKHSKKVLYNHPKVIVGPDITFMYPFPISKVVRKDIWALNILDWHWWDAELYGPKYNLFFHLNTRYPHFKDYYPGKKWDLDKFVDIVKNKCHQIEPFALYFDKNFIDGGDLAWKYFQKRIHKFTITPLHKSRYLISMRYHGLLFACQTGIPFISLSYERKNTNFCKDIGLSKLAIKLKDYQKLESKMVYLKKNYSPIRKTFLAYRKKAQAEVKNIFIMLEKQMLSSRTKTLS